MDENPLTPTRHRPRSIQTKLITSTIQHAFNIELNRYLLGLNETGSQLVDIKFSKVIAADHKMEYSALVIYDDTDDKEEE